MSKFATKKNDPASTLVRPAPRKRATPLVTSSVPVVRKASRTAIVTNAAGGRAFRMSDLTELTTTAFCGLLRGGKDKPERMYETEEARMQRVANLVRNCGNPEYVAKLALSLRIQHGQRSMSHLLAALLADQGTGDTWRVPFYTQVCVRADDPSNIVAAYAKFHPQYTRTVEKKGKGMVKHLKLPSAMKKGLAKAFSYKWDGYRLAKYAGGQLTPSLVDMINLLHPKPTAKVAKAIKALMKGELKNEDTWEAMLSEAGQKGKSKKQVWTELVTEGKLGQLGLLRNLRNIANEVTLETLRVALEQLTNEEAIRKSGILPMQYLTAYEVLTTCPHSAEIKAAIDDAVEIAAGNVPSLGKSVLMCIDESGSMGRVERDNAALFAAVMLKANPKADLMYFANTARYATYNRKLPIMELMSQIRNGMHSGGTDFTTIFTTANKHYDAIVILSDQEGWMSGGAPIQTQAAYERTYGKPIIFTFDLGGDGALMFREDGIIMLAGFSFHVFKLLNILKEDRTKLVDVIDKITIGQPLPSLDGDDE